MKLRNKRTGEIIEQYPDRIVINSGEQIRHYDSLAELNKEWEDYEEPKNEQWYWCVDYITCGVDRLMYDPDDPDQDEFNKSIGNYFDTREQAEKAVEKLKAWKRLKEYGVKFNLDFVKNKIDFTYSINNTLLDVLDGEEQIFNNMKIVFGGEE